MTTCNVCGDTIGSKFTSIPFDGEMIFFCTDVNCVETWEISDCKTCLDEHVIVCCGSFYPPGPWDDGTMPCPDCFDYD